MATVAEIEARRAARKAAIDAAREDQFAVDLEALDALEQQHGDGRVARVDLSFYEPGLPTMVVARMPDGKEWKRYQDMCVSKVGDPRANSVQAANLLAEVCIVYPDGDVYKRLRERSPGVHTNVAVEAIRLAQGRAAEEGKG